MVDSLMCLSCRERYATTRGLCVQCYSRLHRRVRKGQTTWAQLEQEGESLRSVQGAKGKGRKRKKGE